MIQKIRKRLAALIKGGFLHILTGSILSKAITMLSGIVIARMIDKSEYAYLSYADNLYAYLPLLTGLGLSSALLKYCGVKNDMYHEKAYFSYAATYGTAFELTISLLLCIAVTFVDIPYPRARMYMWMLCLYPPLSHLYSVLAMYIRTQYENRRYALGGIMQSVAVCIFSIVFLLVFGITGIVAARYAATLLVLVYLGVFVHRKFKGVSKATLSKEERKRFLGMGLSLMTANLFSGMMPINEAFLVNNIIKDEIITANFRVAGMFPSMLLLFAGALTVYYFPIVSQMTDWAAIRKSIIHIGIFAFVFLGVIAAIGVVLTPLTIRLLYGEKYLDAIPMTYMLWGMRAMNCCIRIVPMNLLPAIGKTKFNAWVTGISCLVQIAIDYCMINAIGILGVAWGAIIVYGISGAASWIYILRACKKNITKASVTTTHDLEGL